jgi:hypothetical protein
MRGSIKKRGSTYTYVIDIGPDPLTGKRRQRTKGGFRTRKSASRPSTMSLRLRGPAPSSSRPSAPWRASLWRSGYQR